MRLSPGDEANQLMVDRLIAEGALWSPALIAAFRATPRHHFLDRIVQLQRRQNRWREVDVQDAGPELHRIIYSDRALITRLSTDFTPGAPVPVSSSSQPSLMAHMLEDLKLGPGLSALEIGAGTGYNAAIMAHILRPGHVRTLDVDDEVVGAARRHLARYPDRDVEVMHADGRNVIADGDAFDRIIVTAATADLEPAWLDQLAERGLLLAPLTLAPGLSYVVRGSVSNGQFHGRLTRAAYFMPLRAEGETGPSDTSSVAPRGELRAIPAPWAGWFDRRRPRLQWLGFSQAIAFYGLLRGLEVHYRVTRQVSPTFGLSQGESLCWYGAQEWEVNGEAGETLGWTHWRAFLDAGGPWPTEFRLKADPHSLPEAGHRESYQRRGARCYQRWELLEPRDRPMWL